MKRAAGGGRPLQPLVRKDTLSMSDACREVRLAHLDQADRALLRIREGVRNERRNYCLAAPDSGVLAVSGRLWS